MSVTALLAISLGAILTNNFIFAQFLGSGKFGGGLLGGGGLGSAPGLTIFPEQFGIKILTLPVGGFLTLGALIAVMQWALAKSKKKKEAK